MQPHSRRELIKTFLYKKSTLGLVRVPETLQPSRDKFPNSNFLTWSPPRFKGIKPFKVTGSDFARMLASPLRSEHGDDARSRACVRGGAATNAPNWVTNGILQIRGRTDGRTDGRAGEQTWSCT